MATSGLSTEDLVQNVLDMMKKSGDGSVEDAEALADESEAEVTPVVEPDALTCSARTFPRPNGTKYHVRKLGIHDDIALLQRAREKNINPLLTGLPGTGKTALIEAAFGDGGFFTVQGNGDTEVADFVGSYVPTGVDTFEWKDGPLLRAMEEGKVLYVDEIALVDPKVLALVYGVMDGRAQMEITQNPLRGTVESKPGFFVVAACNPNAPGARMSEALLSRFALQFEVTTDYKLAKKLGVPDKVVRGAMNLAQKVKEGECQWSPQLRELLDFKRCMDEFGEDLALRNMVGCAPEAERPTVSDVLGKAVGKTVETLRVS